MGGYNPRRQNGSKRNKARAWVLATFDHCGICGLPVDKDLPAGHPMAPEVDEIIPVSKGGSPYDHDNLRLCHRLCNERRGNKMLSTANRKPLNSLKRSRDW